MKNAIIAVLIIVIAILGYMLLVNFPQKAKAQCEETVTTQVTGAVQQCQQALQQIMQIPACVSALSQ
jgi:type II secretory pathway pseudopilin PulG